MRHLYKISLATISFLAFNLHISYAQTVDFSSTITQNGCNIATYDFISTYLDAGGNPPVPGTVFYHWDFGNGTQSSSVPQSTDANTQRVYTAPGQYNVLLRVYSGASFASTLLAQRIKTITVYTNITPDFTANQTDGCIPYTVTLTDLTDYASSPLVGTFVSRTWNFGDGNTTTITNAATTTVTHTYTNPGDFQITLTIRTSGGRVGEECVGTRVRLAYIRVRHTPIAGFTVNSTPAPCNLPFTPQFTNTSTIATTPTPAGTITSYIWRFYTDATATTETSFSPITLTTAAAPTLPAGAYSAVGTYAVSLTAISSTGCTNTFTNNSAIVITNPTADFSPNTPTGTCAAQTATFTDNSSNNPVSWAWSFPGASPASSTAQNPTVTYNSSGTFNVTLVATYANGCTRTTSKPYTVRPLPLATFTVSPVDGYCNAPKTVQFIPNIANQVGYTYFWNFGETNNAGLNPGPTSTLYNPTNLYELFGNYNVSLTVTDPSGCSNTFIDVLQIIEPNVTIVPRLPVQGCAPFDATFDFTASAIEPITRYTIDYGDGTVLTVNSPPIPLSIPGNQTHTYTTAGVYTASLEIETLNGCVRKVFSTEPIKVGQPPVINSVTVVNGGGAGCKGPISFIPVFAPGVLVDSVAFDYGEGAPFGSNTAPYNATYTFTQNGTRTLTVRAFYNGCPMLLPYTQSITIDGPIASLAVVGAANICTGSNQACFNILGSLPATSGAANTTYSISFGDGTVQTGNLSDAGLGNICHVYATPASYPVSLTLNGNGCNDNAGTTITISTTALVDYDVVPNPAISCSANQITFTSTSSSSSPGVTITQYIWDYDDGVIQTLNAPAGASTTHTYIPRTTPYNPKLSIRLSNGCVYPISPANIKPVNIQGPIPTITGLPSLLGCTTVPVNFQGNATLVPNTNAITNWFWDFGDPASGVNNQSSLQNPSHNYVNPGTYTVTLRVKDNNTLTSGSPVTPGCEAIATATVQVFAKPTVSFTQSQTIPCVGSAINFNLSTNAGAGATYAWDFGDGGTSTAQNPSYAFATIPLGTSANRTVSVTVTSVNGCATIFTRNITVANPDVVITANGSTSPITIACPPSSVNFTSTLTPAVIAGSGWTYQWDFGDGNQATTPNATNDYIAPNAPSIFNVTFTATNTATGCSVTKNLTAFVTINGPRGTFDFAPKFVCYPTTVTFELTSQQGSPTQIEWDHGDGTTSGPLALPVGATHTYTYTKSGNFLPIMTLYNSTGCKIGYPSTVGRLLSSGPPTANFTWTGGGQICRDVTVNFTDQSSADPLTNPGAPLNPQVNRWIWTIYDGQNDTDPILAVYNTQNPSHVFNVAKSYKVRLSIRSAFNQNGTPDGCPATLDKEITIVNPSVTASINSILPAQRCPGEVITFTGSGTTSVTPNNLVYQWRFFNRTGGPIASDTTGTLIGIVNGAVAMFSFPNPGTYVAKLVVRDVALCTGGAVSTTEVVVDPLPTYAPSSGPDNVAICVGEDASFSVTASASALAAPGVTYQWQVNDGGGWANISNGATLGGSVYAGTTSDNLTITAGSFNLNTYQYRCIITKQNTTLCQAVSNSAVLTVNQNATTAVINPPVNTEVCNITTFNLSANTPIIGTGTWIKLAGSPAGGTITNPNDPNSAITSLQYGLYTYRWTISNGVCPPTFADFTIRNIRPADAGADQNLCNATSFTLSANDPVASGNGAGSAGQWSVVSGPNTPTITPINSPNATVTGIIASTTPYVLRWSILGSSACGNSTDDVSITNFALPSVVNPLPQTVCVGQNATFAVSGAPTLNYQWQEDNGSGSGFVNLINGATYAGVNTQTLTINSPSVSFNTFKYRVLVTNTTTTCFNVSSAAELTVFPAQSAVLTALPAGPVCQGENITLSLSATTTGYTYQLRVGAVPVAGVPVINGNGAAQNFVAFAPNATNTYNVLVTSPTVNGVNCQQQLASTTSVTVNQTPTTSVAGPNRTVCTTSSSLSGNTPASGTGTWFLISGTGTINSPNSPTSNVNSLGIGNNVFEWRISNGVCAVSTSQMTITRVAAGNVAVAGANQNVCAITATLNANVPVNGGVGTWTTSGIATIDSPNSPNSTVSNLALGNNTFTWTIVDACGTTTSNVVIVREQAPTTAIAGPDQNTCNTNTATLIANTATSGTGQWFVSAGFGTFADAFNPNTTVSNLANGLNTFEWRIFNACGTSSDFVNVTVSPNPSTSAAGPDQTFCGTSTVMNATVPSIGTGTWTLVSGSGVIVNPNSPTSTITNLDIGTNVFRWTVGNGICPTTFDEVSITRETNNTFAYAGPNQILCGTQVTLTANTPSVGTNFYWTLAPGTTLVSGTLGVAGGANGTPTITVDGLVLGSNTFRWTVTNSCATSISDVNITRVDNTSASNAGINQTICADNTTLAGNTPTVGTGTWSTTVAGVTIVNPNLPNTSVINLPVGNTLFTWTINNGTCTPTTSNVIVARQANPDVSNAGTLQNICGATATLAGNNPTVGSGIWTVIQGGGTVDNPTQFNSTVSNLSVGVNKFRWTITNGTCAPSFSEVTINSFAVPSTASAGADNLACAPDGILSATSPSVGTGTWTLISGSGSIVSPNSPSTSVTGLALGANVFRWTVTNGVCPSASNFDEVTLTRRGSVSLSVAGVSETICGNTYTLNANAVNTAQGETGTWTAVGGTIAVADLTNPNATATNLQVGVNAFTWTVNNGCATSVSTVFITRQDNTTIANAGANQNICANSTTLAGNQAVVGTGQWSVISVPAPLNLGDITFDDATKFNAIASGMTLTGNYVLRWTITNTACTPAATSTSNVTITRQELPTASIANPLPQVDICTDVYTMQGNTPTIGTGNWSLVSGNGTFVGLTSNPNVQVTNIGIGINVFKWTVSNGSCPPSESTVIINRATYPTVANAGAAQSICANNTLMAGNTPIIGQGTWTVQSVPAPLNITDISFSSVNDPQTQASGFTVAGTYVLVWTINNPGCPPTTSTVTITRTNLPLVANAGTSIPICANDLTLAGNTPLAGQGTGAWTVVSQVAGTNIVFNNANLGNTLATGFTLAGNYTLRWTISNGNCPPSVSEIVITRVSPPTVANAGSNQSICASSTTLAGNTPSIGSGIWTVISAPAGATPTFSSATQSNSVVNGLTLDGDYVFEWRISNAPCSPSFATVTITRTVPPSTANAGGPYAPICVDDINLNATVPTVGTGQWSVVSQPAGTNVTFSSPGLATSSANGLTLAGNYVFKWTVSNGLCPVSESNIVITRQASPTVANAGANQSICASSTTLAGNLPAIGLGQWTVLSQPVGANATFANAAQNNSVVNGITLAGDYVFRWTITNGACPPSIADVTITRTDLPTVANAGGPYPAICGDNVTLNANVPTVGIGTWSVISQPAGTNVNFSNLNVASSTANGLTLAGTYTFKWTISNGNCPVSESTTTITREALPSVANAGANQNICADQAILAANTPSVGIGNWTVVSQPVGATTIFANANQANTTASGLTLAGIYVLRWTISNASCPASISEITITRANAPSTSIAGTVAPTCTDNVTMAATPVAVGLGTWTVVNAPLGSSVAFVNVNDAVSQVNGLTVAGNYVFKWTTTNGLCPANESTVTVIRQANPSIANAGTNQTTCLDNVILSGNNPSVGIGTWSVVSGTATIANTNQSNTQITGLGIGTNIIRWTIANGTCTPSTSDVTITRLDQPTVSNAGANQSTCANSLNLNANVPTNGLGQWSVISVPSGAVASFNNNASNTATVSGLTIAGNYVFRWTISNGTCAPSTSEVTITREVNPTVANAGSNQNTCGNSIALNANVPTVGTGTWSIVSQPVGASASFGNANQNNTSVNGLTLQGDYIFRWTIANGTCSNSISDVTISKDAAPTTAVITTPSASICANTQALNANTVTTGTGQWSVVSAPIGATVTFTNASANNTTANGLNVAGAYILKWTVSNGTCPPSESTVTITREALPSISNAGINQNTCVNSIALNANVPIVGTGTWSIVSQPAGANATFANAGIANTTLSALTVAGDYILRWTITNGTCTASTSDVTISKDVAPSPSIAGTNQSTCNATFNLGATAPSVGTGQWTVVSVPSGAFVSFDNTSNPNALASGLTLAGNYVFRWTVSNGSCSANASTVTITKESTPSTSIAGTDQTICGTTSTLSGNVPSIGSGTWTSSDAGVVFSNPNSATSSVSNLAVGTTTFTWTISNGTCSPSASTMSITRLANPSTSVITTASSSICSSSQALTATAPTVGTGQWSAVSAPSGATVTFTNASSNNTTANGLNVAGAYILKWTVTNGTCPPSESTVTINREAAPSTANAGTNQTTCLDNVILSSNNPSVGIGTWSVVSGTATIANANQFNTQITALGIGTNILRWTISNGTCTPSTSDVSITRLDQPTASNAGVSQNVCTSSATLAANTPIVGTGTWTLVSGSGTFVNANNPTTTVNGLSAGANVFKWTIANGTCAPSESAVTITREASPTIANAGVNQNTCANSVNLNANVPIVGTGTWSIVSQPVGANATFTNSNQNTSAINGLTIDGAYTLRWTISNGTCSASTADVVITRDPAPTPSVITTVSAPTCTNTQALSANAVTTGTGTWSVMSAPSGAAVSFTNVNANNTTANGLTVAGNYIFKWTVSNGGCPNSESTITITRDALPSISNAGINQNTCANSIALNANVPTVGTGTWSIVSQPAGANAIFGNVNQHNTTLNALTIAGNYTLRWTISNGTCTASTSDVTITKDISPSASNAGASQTICNTSLSLNANLPVNGAGTWSVVSVPSGASVSFNNANANDAIASGLTISGNYVFKWTISNGTCPNSESNVTITKEAAPTTANAGNNQVICANSTTLNGNVPTIGTGTWSIVSQPVGASALFINPTQNNTTVSGLTLPGNYILRWSISNGACAASVADVTIIREVSPTLSNAGANQAICVSNITLNGNVPTVGTGTWSVVSAPSGTAVSFNNANLNNATASGLTLAGNYVFKWAIANGNCANSESTVTITRDVLPSNSIAGANQSACTNTATLNANLPSIGIGTWSIVSQPVAASASFTNINQNNTAVNNLTVPGVYVLRWTIANGTCTSSSSDVSITREVSPTTANAGTNEIICQTSYTLSGNVPTVGTGTWSVVSAPAGVAVSFNNANQNNATASSLTVLGVYVFKWTISNGICPASESTVSITRETGPSPADAGQPQTVCATNAFLTGNNPSLGTGTWAVESGGATIVNPNSATTQVTNLAIGPNVFRWTITGSTCPPTSSLVTITRLDNPTTATVQNNFSVCTNVATLNGNAPTIGSGQWVVVSGGASVNTPNNPTTQVSNLSLGANVFKWVISNGNCPVSEASITVTRESANTTADAGQPQSLCAISATLLANNPAVGAGVWTVESGGAAIVNPNSNITQVNGLSVGPNIFRWTITSATCPQTFSLVTITRFADPSVATVANDFDVCAATSILNGNTPAIGTGQWVVMSGGASVNSPNNPTSQVSNLAIGANVFKWVISNGNCTPTEATITITRLANPSPANAGINQEVCATTATLSANNPSIGIGQWTVVSGSANINSPNSHITGVTNLSVGDNVFRWTVSNGICPISESTVTITRYAVPTIADAGVDISTCGGTSITLNAVAASIGIGTWTQLSGPSNAIFVNANSPNTQVNGLVGGIYTFRWRVANGVCPATQDEVTATIVPNPNTSANLVVQDLTICEAFQQNINITVSNTQAGVTYELRNGAVVLSSINSSGGLITFTIPSPITTPAPSTTYTFDVYAIPALLNNVQCPALLLVDKSIVKVDICNNPIANRLLRTTDFCTLLKVNVITATENNNNPDNFTSNPINNFVTLAGGVVNMDFNGNLTYLPRTNFVGVDSVSYTICNKDNPNRCSTSKVLISILPCTNDAPDAKNDAFNTDNCNVVGGNALGNDTDGEGNPLTVIPSTPILSAAGGVFDIKADGSFEYTPKVGFVGQDSITYTACDNGDNGTSIVKCDEAKIFFNVVNCEDVFVPDGFSPNGDGTNDKFVIVGAERYDILLRVYDRWGNLSYESQHYLNDWDSRPNKGVLSNNSEGLPDGTYFYIADFRDGKKARASYLIIQR